MLHIDHTLRPADLADPIERLFKLAARTARALDRAWDPASGSPVFTVNGRYTTRGWTEWTQGFQFGCLLLAGDVLDDDRLIQLGKRRTLDHMLRHVTHVGVHDHAFNNLSTYGNLLRLMAEKRLPYDPWEEQTYRDLIAASGAIQAARWADLPVQAYTDLDKNAAEIDLGFVTSFNGPHSLFIDTMRTLRILNLAHDLGHVLQGEGDRLHNLLGRSIRHALTTSKYIVFHGQTRHTYDVAGRTAHEGIFNRADGAFRCRSTQQGYSPFSTWTRGLSWSILGYAEQLEHLATLDAAEVRRACGLNKSAVVKVYEKTCAACCDHYIADQAATDGVPYWDDGAPGMAELGNWQDRPAEPYNDYEPVDASAAAITAQGLLRFASYLADKGRARADDYLAAGLTIAETLLHDPYVATPRHHQGILLHSVYHRPNNWDNIPRGRKVPCDESCMWGDYHLLELAHLIHRMAARGPYPTFYSCAR